MIAVKIANLLNEKDNIAIISHTMPDGDSLGSMLALYTILKRLGKKVEAFTADKLPEIYSFLPQYSQIKVINKEIVNKYDMLIILDCGDIKRTGDCSILIDNCNISINIDHHLTNMLFADVNLVDTNASATSEIIYQIIKLMGINLQKEEAICLYTAIMTDTGGFRYSNTTSITHQIAGDLINTGIDFSLIYEKIYRSFDYNTIKIMARTINNMELYANGKVSYIQLLKKDVDGLNIKDINTSDFIDYARDIDTVEVALFIKETDNEQFKASFRSKNIVDVRYICEKHGGGGHKRAAGCGFKGDILSIKKDLINELINALEDDDN